MTLQTDYAAILDIIEKNIFEIWDNLENNANKPDGFANRFATRSDDKSSITDYSKLGFFDSLSIFETFRYSFLLIFLFIKELKYRFPPQTSVKKTSWKMHVTDMV